MTTVQKVPRSPDGRNPAGWAVYGANNFQWAAEVWGDYPATTGSRITANTVDYYYTDYYSGAGGEFSIPTDATVNAVRVRINAKKNTASSSAMAGRLYVGGVWRIATAQALSTTAGEYVFEWTTNPATGAAWTPTQINSHSATNAIPLFGFGMTDVTSDADIYNFVIEVDYTPLAGYSGTVTLDDSTVSGSFASGASTFAGAVTLDASTPSGSFGAVPGSITSPPLKVHTTGVLLASVGLAYVAVYDASTGALVTRQTGLSTGVDGRFTISHASIVPGTSYRVDWETATGERRMPVAVAA